MITLARSADPAAHLRNDGPETPYARLQADMPTLQQRHHKREDKKSGPGRAGGDRPQQPADVEAGCAQYRVQRISLAALQPAPVQPVVGLDVSDHGLDGLTPV